MIINPKRRHFLKLVAATTGLMLSACGTLTRHSRKGPRVVVVGGGFGGATAAKYLRMTAPEVEVVLIERKASFITCPFSNAVLAGMQGIEQITHSYQRLRQNHGIQCLQDTVTVIDPERQEVRLASGARLVYDRLIVSPGIDICWGELEGYDQTASTWMPHAWQGGPQTLLLKKQLQAMPDDGLVLISAPANPYRCPPGPYERASLIAHYLKQHKPRAKLLVLDSKNAFAKQQQFMRGWQHLYPGMIEWVPLRKGGRVIAVEAQRGIVHSEIAEFKPAVANIIPPQCAGHIAQQAGLTDETGWCPVDQQSFESRRVPGIHVIGDSALAGQMPKSAFAANSQAKVCAHAVAALLGGREPPIPSLLNTCYSLIGPDYGISVAAVYRLHEGKITAVESAGGVTPLDASREDLSLEAEYARGWYTNIIADSFG